MLEHSGELDGKACEELGVGKSKKVLAQYTRPEGRRPPIGTMELGYISLFVPGDPSSEEIDNSFVAIQEHNAERDQEGEACGGQEGYDDL